MKFLLPSIIFLLSILGSVDAHSQHEIHKKTGEILFVNIVEIGLDEIKYQDPTNPQILISIDKDIVQKIVIDGKEEDINTGFDNLELYAGQKKSAIKLNFLSPLTNYYLEGGYERSIAPGRSMEFNIGFIGVGQTPRYFDSYSYYDIDGVEYSVLPDEESSTGFFVRAGYKFINTPNHYMRGMRYAHILKGGYIKPEIQIGSFFYDEIQSEYGSSTSRKESRSETYGGFILNFGKQWVYSDIFLVDLSVGGGYGFSSNDDVNGQYSLINTSDEGLGFAIRGSLNIGILID